MKRRLDCGGEGLSREGLKMASAMFVATALIVAVIVGAAFALVAGGWLTALGVTILTVLFGGMFVLTWWEFS